MESKKDEQLFNTESEEFLLGSLINNNNLVQNVEILHKNHFYSELNSYIFEAILKIVNRGFVSDVKTIFDELVKNKNFTVEIEKEELRQYLLNISGLFTITTIGSLANEVYFLYLKRNLIEYGKEAVSSATEIPITELAKVVDSSLDKLSRIQDSLDGKKDYLTSLGKHIESVIQRTDIARRSSKHITGIPSGLIELDNVIGGLKKSELTILAARPSMGKTALAVSIAYNIARNIYENEDEDIKDKNVLLFSLEMSGEQISSRIASMHSGINARTFETGRMYDSEKDQSSQEKYKSISDIQFKEISEILQELSDLPLYIDSSPALKISTLVRKAKKMHRLKKIGIIFVDYLQLVRGELNDSSNRVQEVSEVTQALKRLARELEIPVVALAQLSRAVESRESSNYKPQLSDLRESGSIEQDADVVMFLYRESYYLLRNGPEDPDKYTPESDRNTTIYHEKKEAYRNFAEKLKSICNVAQLIVSKNRNGSIGTATCHFEPNILRFSNLAHFSYNEEE